MTVAIIGAGPAGLTSGKNALECGLTPTLFEKKDSLGGVWREKTGFAWDSMQTNIFYGNCMFSDHPWKKPPCDFPNRSQVLEYLEDYAKTFTLIPHIHLNAEVIKVKKFENRWHVQWIENNQIQEQDFDYLIVASGIFSKPYIPPLEGIDTFAQTTLHSSEYKNPQNFKDKTVAIVGSAFSAVEIATDLTKEAKKVTSVTRNIGYIIPRYFHNKAPLDFVFYTRHGHDNKKNIPETESNRLKHSFLQGLTREQQNHLCLQVKDPTDSPPFVAVSDTYIEQVKKGSITVINEPLEKITKEGIQCKNGFQVKADTLIFCTGYRVDLPFFDQEALATLEFDPDDPLQPLILGMGTFRPEWPNAAFVGMYRGPFFGGMELQARLAYQMFIKAIPFPEAQTFDTYLIEARSIRNKNPRPQFPYPDYVFFCDTLAAHLGALPPLQKIKYEDPSLYEMLYDGPVIPPHYRLTGPHSKAKLAKTLIQEAFTCVKKESYEIEVEYPPMMKMQMIAPFTLAPDLTIEEIKEQIAQRFKTFSSRSPTKISLIGNGLEITTEEELKNSLIKSKRIQAKFLLSP